MRFKITSPPMTLWPPIQVRRKPIPITMTLWNGYSAHESLSLLPRTKSVKPASESAFNTMAIPLGTQCSRCCNAGDRIPLSGKER